MLENRLSSSEQFELGWWIEIITKQPNCIYYFGPFSEWLEAESSLSGYQEDLAAEGSEEIQWKYKYFQPKELTISSES